MPSRPACATASRASYQSSSGNYLRARDQYRAAIPLFEQALRDLDARGSVLSAARQRINLGACRRALGDVDEGAAELNRAYVAFRTYLGPHHPETAIALGSVAAALADQGDFDGSIAAFERSVARLHVGGPGTARFCQ